MPAEIFNTERWDNANGEEMQYAFPVSPGNYEVNLYLGNSYGGTSQPGQRIFDVSVEGVVPSTYNDIDPAARFGNLNGARLSHVTAVIDGELNIEFLHGTENPLINGIEIVALLAGAGGPADVDSDGDGVVDRLDAFPNDPTETRDLNGNGIGDNADAAAKATSNVLFRVNSAGPTIASLDGNGDWQADGAFLSVADNPRSGPSRVTPGAGVPAYVPAAIFNTER